MATIMSHCDEEEYLILGTTYVIKEGFQQAPWVFDPILNDWVKRPDVYNDD